MSDTSNEGTTDNDDWGSAEAQPNPIPGSASISSPSPSSAEIATATQKNPAAVFQELSSSNPSAHVNDDLDMILDIPVQITVELGRTRIAIKNLLQLAQGSVVELDVIAGEPMDVLVNGCLIAQGEVVVVNERFGVRLTDIITPSERIRKLNR
jgi:flagellar motor switch protein FliN/FliY